MMTRDELWTKFSDCAQRVLAHATIAPLFEKMLSVAAIETVTELTTLLRYPGHRDMVA